MKTGPGFSLIECLIYAAIMGILSVLVFSSFNRTVLGMFNYSQKQHIIMAQSTVEHLLHNDIQKASADASHWKIDESWLICRQAHECIGWHTKNSSLYRCKGIYNFTTNQWSKIKNALIASDVRHFSAHVNAASGRILSAGYIFQIEDGRYCKTVPLINGIGKSYEN